MLVFGKSFSKHVPWLIVCFLVTLFSIIWYFAESHRHSMWLSGSSRPGLVFGIVGAVLIAFEMLLWPRKKLRAWRIGRAQHWMRAHIWLGLLTLPLVILHTGFRFGGQFNTALAIAFYVVIASGILGLAIQNIVPRLMLESIPAETIYAQIDSVVRQHAQDAQRKVDRLCPKIGEASANLPSEENEAAGPIVIGAVRQTGSLRGKVLTTSTIPAPISNPTTLRTAFDETILPFLLDGSRTKNRLADRRTRETWFSDLRESVDPAAHETLTDLQNLCEQRRQFELQKRLHWLLHGWLALHVGLSLAMTLMLTVHVVMAIRYW